MSDHGKVEQGSREEFQKLVSAHDVCLLTTIGEDGHLRTRPMAMQKHHSEGSELWFAAWADSEKIHDLQHHQRCAIAFHDGEHDAVYLSVSGRGELVRDLETVKEKWDASWKPWFPEGPEGNDIALIKFIPEHAEYVNPRGGKVKVALEALKALMTHRAPEPGPKMEIEFDATH